MSGELPFIDLNGLEVANAYRTMEYLRRGLGPVNWQVAGQYPCGVLAREVGGVAPFVSPSADPAPWYDAATPESAEFLGFIPRIDFQTISVARSISQRFGGIGGGVIGVEQVAARGVVVKGMLIASSCAGLEYGRHWLYSKLGADCAGCSLGTIRVRESCPPEDGSNDTRGERLIYDAALVSGITRTDDGGQDCCDYDGIEFALAGQSPYLYARASAPSAPVTLGDSGYLMPVAPAILDTMVRANTGPPPSASWTGSQFPGMGNTLRILSNVLDNNTHTLGTVGAAYWNAATFGPDVAVTIVVPTRVNLGAFELHARIVNPTLANATGIVARITFGSGGGLDSCIVGRRTGNLSTGFAWNIGSAVGTYATGDTFALVVRGYLVEVWRKPSGADWVRLVAGIDPATQTTGSIGVAIVENGATQTLGAFGGGTLTNGSAYPTDVDTIVLPAQSIGILAPIITINQIAANVPATQNASRGIRMQLKSYPSCSETDEFGTNTIPTNWWQAAASYAISTGKMRPTGTSASPLTIYRSRDGTQGNVVRYQGGRVEAVVTLGATIAAGAWGVIMDQAWAGLRQTGNLFALGTTADTGTADSVAFTPIASTTYRIILEVLTTTVVGSYDVRAYLINQSAPNTLVTRPLRATIVMAGSGEVRPFGISSIPKDVTEAWDSFYAIDYSDSTAYMEAAIPGGVLVVDTPQRVTEFTPQGGVTSLDASAYITTPLDTPLGWPDVCAGASAKCLQVFGREVAWPGTTVTVATQQRVR